VTLRERGSGPCAAETLFPISEKARRARQRAQSLDAVERLLYSRKQTAHVLGGVSIATILRMEARGLLDKVRLAGVRNGAVFHRAEQVRQLAEGKGAGGAAKTAPDHRHAETVSSGSIAEVAE
jgi:hypothetical protein